jgi:MFS family permease
MINKVFPILAISTFSSLLGAGIIVPLLPIYAETLGATGIWLGSIAAGFFASNAIFTPIFGRVSDRKGRKVFISIGLFCYTIASFCFLGASNVPQLALVRFIQGIAGGMILPIAQAYVGDIAPVGEEGKWMGYFNATLFTGFGIGPLIGGTLTEQFGMSSAFIAMGALNLLAFSGTTFFLPEIKERKTSSSPNVSFRKMGRSNMVKGLFSFRLAFAIGRGAFATFLPIFSGIYLGLSPLLIGVLLAVNLLLMSLLQVYSGNIADRFNRKTLVIIGSIINFVYFAFIPLSTNFWQLLAICVFGGLGGAVALPAASALTVEEGKKFGMGSTIAIFTIAFSLGMTIGPLISGLIADFVDISSVFYFASTIGLSGAILFIWFTR